MPVGLQGEQPAVVHPLKRAEMRPPIHVTHAHRRADRDEFSRRHGPNPTHRVLHMQVKNPPAQARQILWGGRRRPGHVEAEKRVGLCFCDGLTSSVDFQSAVARYRSRGIAHQRAAHLAQIVTSKAAPRLGPPPLGRGVQRGGVGMGRPIAHGWGSEQIAASFRWGKHAEAERGGGHEIAGIERNDELARGGQRGGDKREIINVGPSGRWHG
jgi:hypothetical protein